MGSSSQVMLGGVARNVCREGRILSSGSPTSLIPTSLAFLSTTSSSEAQEALKHVDRLDRNRDGTKRLNYAIVGPSELATVNKLLYATYHPYEPLTSHLGLCKGPNSIADMDKMVESILEKNLTLIASGSGRSRRRRPADSPKKLSNGWGCSLQGASSMTTLCLRGKNHLPA